MKKIILLIALSFTIFYVNAQKNCIDAIILNTQEGKTDTIFCKIMSEDELNYTIDNGFAITSISKLSVNQTFECVREMSTYEIYKYRGIDNVTRDYFQNTHTSGEYLRKAAFNAYLATGLAIVGTGGVVLGVTVFKNAPSQYYWIVGGAVFGAAALFFAITSWNQVYKAGKLLDLNDKAALYLAPTSDGNIGMKIKF